MTSIVCSLKIIKTGELNKINADHFSIIEIVN